MRGLGTRMGAALLLAAALSGPRPARAEVIERVVAVVNDQAIFLSEVRRRMLPFLPRVFELPSEQQQMAALGELQHQVVDRLVEEELIRQAASRMHVRVTGTDIDRAVHNVMRQNGLTEEQFWEAVQGQGFTRAQYRGDLRRQLLRLKVLNQRARGHVNITEEDVRRVYEQRIGQAHRRVRLHVAHAFFASGDGAEEQAEEARRDASSEAFTDLGWLDAGDLPEAFERAVEALAPGQASEVVATPDGLHVFRLLERGTGDAEVPSFESMRDEIYRGLLDRAMQQQEEALLTELRRDASIDIRL